MRGARNESGGREVVVVVVFRLSSADWSGGECCWSGGDCCSCERRVIGVDVLDTEDFCVSREADLTRSRWPLAHSLVDVSGEGGSALVATEAARSSSLSAVLKSAATVCVLVCVGVGVEFSVGSLELKDAGARRCSDVFFLDGLGSVRVRCSRVVPAGEVGEAGEVGALVTLGDVEVEVEVGDLGEAGVGDCERRGGLAADEGTVVLAAEGEENVETTTLGGDA